MNEDDSEQIASVLSQMGYTPTEDQNEADIIILVTCSVRAKPENKARSKLGELKEIKAIRPDMIIGIYGCMAQREGDALKRYSTHLDLVIGTANIYEIPQLIAEIKQKRRFTSSLDLPENKSDELIVPKRVDRKDVSLKAFVPVMYGCDNFCAYCVVPYVRGRERSRPVDDILDEIKNLADSGCKEVTLLGQNVNSYGATLDENVNFADLLYKVHDVNGIERIRFVTSHPKDLSDSLIQVMVDLPKICRHIHLAVQSGDDKVLERMNRKYDSDHIRKCVSMLRSAMPDIAISTDFLVGFPGETVEQFENTLKLAEEIRFDAAYMFAYSIIPDTAAAKMDNQMTTKEKNARLGKLIEIQSGITYDINKNNVGNVYEVLVEGVSSKDSKKLCGLTSQNKTVNFVGEKSLTGKIVKVKTIEGYLYGFTGVLNDV